MLTRVFFSWIVDLHTPSPKCTPPLESLKDRPRGVHLYHFLIPLPLGNQKAGECYERSPAFMIPLSRDWSPYV